MAFLGGLKKASFTFGFFLDFFLIIFFLGVFLLFFLLERAREDLVFDFLFFRSFAEMELWLLKVSKKKVKKATSTNLNKPHCYKFTGIQLIIQL